MDDLGRVSFLRPGDSYARCDELLCRWQAGDGTPDPVASPRTVAARARKHSRETGHATRVIDTRVTVYRSYAKEVPGGQ